MDRRKSPQQPPPEDDQYHNIDNDSNNNNSYKSYGMWLLFSREKPRLIVFIYNSTVVRWQSQMIW